MLLQLSQYIQHVFQLKTTQYEAEKRANVNSHRIAIIQVTIQSASIKIAYAVKVLLVTDIDVTRRQY